MTLYITLVTEKTTVAHLTQKFPAFALETEALGRAHIETQAHAGQGDAARETLRDTV